MTPAKLRELAGLTEAYVAATMGMGLGTLQLLEAAPTHVWMVTQLAQHAAVCGYVVRIIAVDGHGVEREVT